MKKLLTTIFLIPAIWCNAQTTTQRLNDLEKWRTQAKIQFKNDSLYIVYLRKGKTADSLNFVNQIKQLYTKAQVDSLQNARTLFVRPENVKKGNGVDTLITRQ